MVAGLASGVAAFGTGFLSGAQTSAAKRHEEKLAQAKEDLRIMVLLRRDGWTPMPKGGVKDGRAGMVIGNELMIPPQRIPFPEQLEAFNLNLKKAETDIGVGEATIRKYDRPDAVKPPKVVSTIASYVELPNGTKIPVYTNIFEDNTADFPRFKSGPYKDMIVPKYEKPSEGGDGPNPPFAQGGKAYDAMDILARETDGKGNFLGPKPVWRVDPNKAEQLVRDFQHSKDQGAVYFYTEGHQTTLGKDDPGLQAFAVVPKTGKNGKMGVLDVVNTLAERLLYLYGPSFDGNMSPREAYLHAINAWSNVGGWRRKETSDSIAEPTAVDSAVLSMFLEKQYARAKAGGLNVPSSLLREEQTGESPNPPLTPQEKLPEMYNY